MPISVTCQCGKTLRVKDEWAGKRAKCPGCGNTFMVPAAGAAAPAARSAPSAAGARMWSPQKRGPQQKEGLGASLSVSPKVIVFVALAVLIPTVIFIVRIGPVKAQEQWRQLQEKADSDVSSVVGYGMQCYLQENSGYDPSDSRHTPRVNSVTFDATVIWKVPEYVKFTGLSTEGMYNGKYNTRNGEVEAIMKIIGNNVTITGRVSKDGQITSEVDGKAVKLVIKPHQRRD